MGLRDNIVLPDDFKPQGKIKVELFDDLTGKKVDELVGENFISKGVRDVLFKMAMVSLFTQWKHTGGRDYYYDINDPFEYMVLTDATHAEAPDSEWIIRGNTVGYAYTDGTYSGNDTKRGSYNAEESFTSREQVHIVIDFPTHAANGTFQSIYFTYDGSVFDDLSFFDNPFSNVYKLVQHGGKIYVLGSRTKFYEYDMNFNLVAEYNLSYNAWDFEIYDGYIYFAYEDESNSVWRVPLSNPEAPRETVLGWDDYAYGICFDEIKRQFLVYSGYSHLIRRYNTNWELLSEDPTNLTDDHVLVYHEGDVFAGDQVLDSGMGNFRWAGTGHWIHGFVGDNYYVDEYGYLLPKVGISSRVLLDSPVTKTSNNTMKITYDFMLPSLFE